MAHPDAAAKVDAHPPLDQLMEAQTKCWGKAGADKDVQKGECVVYWMRMEDLRSELVFRVIPAQQLC